MNSLPSGGDLTPVSGAQTDVAPLGRGVPPPPHEQTAAGGVTAAQWQQIADHPEFHLLLKAKARFIIPATIFFVCYYLVLPISVGWFPEVMKQEIMGHANLAYVFAFSQFIMAWVLAWIYVKVAASWDRKAATLISHLNTR